VRKNSLIKLILGVLTTKLVYGDVELPAKEDSKCNPKGFYSITKKCAEDLIISYCQTFKIKYRILRLSNVYGSDDSAVSKKRNALQFLLSEIANNKDISLYYNGNFLRYYMHVSDICKGIYLCVTSSAVNQIINVGSGIPQNFRELVNYAVEKTNSSSKLTNIDATEFHKMVQVKDMYLDCSKLKSLGFKQEVNIFDGINQLLNF
jgi:nucleoside-diphosphate-sugar epimerase